jgi:hypothetical protein
VETSNDWIREHGLLAVVIGVAYLIARDVLGTLHRRLKRDDDLSNASVLSQKADHAIQIAEHNNRRLNELLDEVARLVRRGDP